MKGCSLAILRSLLSEADFFVDGKDLQTFVGATSQSRFFFALSFRFLLRVRAPFALALAGRLRVVGFGLRRRVRPVFHHVVTGVQR